MNKPVMQERGPEATLELHTTDVGAHLGNEAGGAVTVLPKRESLPQSAVDGSSVPSLVEYAIKAGAGIDTIERLVAMQERAMAKQEQRAFVAALADLQSELPVIEKRGKVVIARDQGYTFAKWEDINEAIKEPMKKHGFSMRFMVESADKLVTVTGILSHSAGHSERTTFSAAPDASGSKNAIQALGSTIAYLKRYIAGALLNLTSRDGIEADDDARSGGGKTVSSDLIAPQQVETLQRRLVSLGVDIPKFYQNFAIERLEDLGVPQFGRAMQLLDQRERAAQIKDQTGTLRKQLQDSVAQTGGQTR